MKKIIVAGGRGFDNYKLLTQELNKRYPEPIEVVCGGAKGADNFGRQWAKKQGYPCKVFYPDWDQGPIAGFNRNVEMADYADEAIVFWDGISKGTKHMINIMQGIGKPVVIIKYEEV